MAANKGENIFTKIINKKLKERAYEMILGSDVRCLLKFEDSNLYEVKAISRTGSHISVECPDGFQTEVNLAAIFSFDLGDEKYFIRTKVEMSSTHFAKVSTNADLFKLQRRHNFRVSLPLRFHANLKLDDSLTSEMPVDGFAVNDISLGGLSFDIPSPIEVHFVESEKIQGYFVLPKSIEFSFIGEVKHIRSVGSMGSGLKRVGIHFDPLEPQMENRLLELLIKLQKELVARID